MLKETGGTIGGTAGGGGGGMGRLGLSRVFDTAGSFFVNFGGFFLTSVINLALICAGGGGGGMGGGDVRLGRYDGCVWAGGGGGGGGSGST